MLDNLLRTFQDRYKYSNSEVIENPGDFSGLGYHTFPQHFSDQSPRFDPNFVRSLQKILLNEKVNLFVG